ncbi:MAG: elongation factor 1-beta [Candidatus Thermoplasmatota archaeon]
MGKVIAEISVMPDGVIEDEKLQKMKEDIKKTFKEPIKVGKIEIEKVAFGLKGLKVTVSLPDSEGGLDPVVEKLSEIENVDSAEVTNLGRT